MNLQMQADLAVEYKSRTQSVRVISEGWGARELYCAACESNSLIPAPNNTHAFDFTCPSCSCVYQLKAGARSSLCIPDGACQTMLKAMSSDSIPNLLVLHYDQNLLVRDLLLVPSFLFTSPAIQPRPPLSPTARRAGWIGCNIHLDRIPDEGRLKVVSNGQPVLPESVRLAYRKVRPFAALDVGLRGWALDILRITEKIGRSEFRLDEIYAFEQELAEQHPSNNNIRPKIRQKLQVLRDRGLLEFVSRGIYRLSGW